MIFFYLALFGLIGTSILAFFSNIAGWLTKSGALTIVVLGTAIFTLSPKMTFYLALFFASSYGIQALKKQLHTELASDKNGPRDAWQVLANCGPLLLFLLIELWTKDPRFYDRDRWWENDAFQAANVREEAAWVAQGLDDLLFRHGYVREGNCYRAEAPNEDTIVLFCHFGVECVLLGHLLGISPMPLWHGFCAAPTSVTTVTTEERRQGIASFRVNAFGDTAHLYAAGREPSFSARFCETYSNEAQRHD